MTIIFSPGFFDPTDEIGFGWWRNAHALEHQQFVNIGLLNTPRFFFPNYDLLGWDGSNRAAIRGWLDAHETIHAQLRAAANVEGFDLAEVEWDSPEERLVWMDNHDFEHAQLRAAFRIT